MGHVGREGYEQENTAYEGRIEHILSKASEGHLRNSYGHDRADEDNPPWSGRWQVQGQQYAGHGRRPVSDSGSFLQAVSCDKMFNQHARQDADCQYQQFLPAIEHD